MIKRKYKDFDDTWAENFVAVWTEDDASRFDHTAEHEFGAWERLTQTPYARRGEPITKADFGDCFAALYSNGWAVFRSFDGVTIGVIAEARTSHGGVSQ